MKSLPEGAANRDSRYAATILKLAVLPSLPFFLFSLCHDLYHTLMWPLHATTHLSVYVYVCVCMFGSSGEIPLTMHGRYVQARVQRWMVGIINWKPLPRCG